MVAFKLFVTYQVGCLLLWYGLAIAGFNTVINWMASWTSGLLTYKHMPESLKFWTHRTFSGFISSYVNILDNTALFRYWLLWAGVGVVLYATYLLLYDVTLRLFIRPFWGGLRNSGRSMYTPPPSPDPSVPERNPRDIPWGWIVWLAVFLLLALLPFVR